MSASTMVELWNNLHFQSLQYLFVLLPACLLLWLWRRWKRQGHGYSMVHRFRQMRPAWLPLMPRSLTTLALMLVLLAVLQPVLSLSRVDILTRGLNLVMLVDLSSSMLEYLNQNSYEVPGASGIEPTTKLEAVKDAIRQFVKSRRGDRVGTLVFSERAYVISPLSIDYSYLSDYLDLVDYRTLGGEGRTAIGEAVFSGLRLLAWKDPEGESPAALMIFTDGESNAGRSIFDALEQARERGVRVYIIGLQIWFLPDRDRLLEALAATGGRFFDVQDSSQLEEAYQTIDLLERQPLVTQRYVRNQPYYQPFVVAALACLTLASVLRTFPYFTRID